MEPMTVVVFAFAGVVILAVILAMRHGYIEKFGYSRENGMLITARNTNDAMFLKTIDVALDGIDLACKVQCWRYVLDNRPLFLTPEQQCLAIIPLLEMVSMTSILKAVDLHGFETFCADKQKAVVGFTGLTVQRTPLDNYVSSVVGQCGRFAKEAAARKLTLYETHVKRTDLSPACISVLRDKIEKNRRYLTVAIG